MKIAVLDGDKLNPGDVSWAPIAGLGTLKIYENTPPEKFAERVAGMDVVLVNKTLVRSENVAALSACRLVGVLATGSNNLDLPALAAAGIKTCNVPAYAASDVAQHALAMIMELTNNVAIHSASVTSGEWSRNRQWCYWLKTPFSLAGRAMGIIGFGSIGQALGRSGHALGMRVLANSRRRRANVDYPFIWADIDEILSTADVISLHCPLTQENEHLINKKTISQMKKGALLINTARGGLVDETAVAEALKEGALGGFGTDVLGIEPPQPDNPLFSAPNALITPHMAWATTRARQNIIDIMAENIKAFMSGKPQNIIN